MKKIHTYLLIGLLGVSLSTSAFAQTIDANRMNRDISIMENILGELFKTQQLRTGTNEPTIVVNGVVSTSFSSRSVKGTYLPGYGIIFKINSPSRNIYMTSSGTRYSSYSFYYDGDGDPKLSGEITQETVVDRITSFLRDYGTTIGQLGNDEKIMVIYGSNQSTSRDLFYTLSTVRGQNTQSNDNEDKPEPLPIISVSTTVKDLNDYRSGRLNASAFDNKVDVATSEEKEYLDLKVMGNIFKTALSNQPTNSFKLHGASNVDYLYLDNFGAIFSLNVRYSDENNRWAISLAREFALAQSGFDKEKEQEEYEEYLEKVATAFEELKDNLREYVIDYGRTLSSVTNDQYLLLSITVSGSPDEIPERMDIQVKKSLFQDLDRGQISREQAISQVVVTEY
ncbi:MAG: hypothetical protein ED557_09395 [Balneola sp.]|nr:MAG: hypothetical protein ED557_09395 [Balneola sp.]